MDDRIFVESPKIIFTVPTKKVTFFSLILFSASFKNLLLLYQKKTICFKALK